MTLDKCLGFNLIILLACYCAQECDSSANFSVAFEWNYINFTWSSPDLYNQSTYVKGEDVIAGIKIYKNVIYLALPRIKKSSRVTLASIGIEANRQNPLLSPYPNWEMNSGSSCDAIQNVLSMEIDKDGIMWVLDARRVDNNNTDCPPKIILLDLNRQQGENVVVDTFLVPNELCPHHNGCHLNDIVVDGNYAYISDTTSSDPGIFVFDRATKKAWKARHSSMFSDPSAIYFEAQGVVNKNPSHINGIALCCPVNDERTVYYMPQTSLHIFAIAASVLKNQSLIESAADLGDFISDKGTKQGQSGGMVCDTKDDIYYGILPLDAVGRWHVKRPLAEAEIIEQNHEIIRWPDSFSIYKSNLYLITNSISKFSRDGIDTSEINFRIVKYPTDSESYIHC